MRRIFLLLPLLLVLNASPVKASIGVGLRITADPQTGTHQGQLSWVASVTTGVVYTGFNVYRAICTGTVTAGVCSTDSTATFAKITATSLPAAATSFTDTPLSAATGYIWYVTSLCATCTIQESVPSNHVAGTTTANQPPPPVLSITNIAINNVNGQDRLQVDWTDTNGATTSVNIFGGQGQSLKQVTQTTTNGVYSYAVLIPVQNGSISICDAKGCVTQAFTGI